MPVPFALVIFDDNGQNHPPVERADGSVRAGWRRRSPRHRLRGVAGQIQERDARFLTDEVVQIRIVVSHDEAHGFARLDGDLRRGKARVESGDLNLDAPWNGGCAYRCWHGGWGRLTVAIATHHAASTHHPAIAPHPPPH